MMDKIKSLMDISYQLQNNNTMILRRLSNGHIFLDSDLNKV